LNWWNQWGFSGGSGGSFDEPKATILGIVQPQQWTQSTFNVSPRLLFFGFKFVEKKKIPIEKRFRRLKISDNIFKYKKNERKNFFLLISMG